jgi:hypothetical protein
MIEQLCDGDGPAARAAPAPGAALAAPAKTYVGVGGGILLQSLLQVIRNYDSASSAPRPRRVSASPAQRGAAPPCPWAQAEAAPDANILEAARLSLAR